MIFICVRYCSFPTQFYCEENPRTSVLQKKKEKKRNPYYFILCKLFSLSTFCSISSSVTKLKSVVKLYLMKKTFKKSLISMYYEY